MNETLMALIIGFTGIHCGFWWGRVYELRRERKRLEAHRAHAEERRRLLIRYAIKKATCKPATTEL